MEEEYGSDLVSSFPWKTHPNGSIVKSSVDPHILPIKREIEERLVRLSAKETLKISEARHAMILIFWITQVLRGATIGEIVDSLKLFSIDDTPERIRKYLYCMLVANWVAEKKYGHPVYFYPRIDVDPFDYAFRESASIRSSVRWKSDLNTKLSKSDLGRPKPVLELIGT